MTQPALTTFARLAVIFDPKGLIQWGRNPVYDVLGTLIAYPVFWPLCRFCDWAHCRLVRMSARDSRRAETFADALAVRLGGTDGAMELMQALILDRPTLFALRRSAAQGSADPAIWRDQALAARAELAGELQPREQRSMRYDTSLTTSHPPSGLRHRLVRSWPAADPLVPVPVAALAAADRELAARYEQVRRAILNHHLV